MHSILFIALLLTTHNVLFPMEPLHIEPSNSSSEICFFAQHIDHNLSQQYQLPLEVKNKLLTNYHAVTNDERIDSSKYEIIINSSDYMNLNQPNKQTIQMICKTPMLGGTDCSMMIKFISKNNQTLMLTSLSEAQRDYQKMITLPIDIRHKMADRYSSMILVKERTAGEITRISTLAGFAAPLLITPIIGFTLNLAPTFCLGTTILSCMVAPFIADKYTNPTALGSDKYNGYVLLPLLPEDGEK